MAGRGCTVTVRISRVVDEELVVDEITLPIALHSPLHVLKIMLQNISGISAEAQVLILCDLTDPDRNNDVHLEDSMDDSTLFQCGLREDSTLTLHSSGIGVPRNATNFRGKKNTAIVPVVTDRRPLKLITTRIAPGEANHSYNGVIFNVSSKSPFEVHLFSVFIGGMLGRIVSLNIYTLH